MNNKGVTIVELIIVIAIIAIIASFSTIGISQVLYNVRRDAFAENAEVITQAAKDAHSFQDPLWEDDIATLRELIDNEFIEAIDKDPWGGQYDLDQTFVTVSTIEGLDYGRQSLTNLSVTVSAASSYIFKTQVVSANATLGYEDLLESWTKEDVILLNVSNGSILTRIQHSFDGDIEDDLSTDNDPDDITVDDDIKDNANVNTSGGDDTLTIGDDIKGSSTVNLGDGNDTLNMDGEITGSSSLDTGDGDDTIVIEDDIQDNSTVTTGSGNDSIRVGDDLQSGAVLNTGAGDDIVVVEDELENGSINTGTGNDTVNIDTIRRTSYIDTGDGNDTVSIRDCSSTFDSGSVQLGSGNDTLTILDNSSSKHLSGTNGSFDGGDGTDILNLPNVTLSLWNSRVSALFSNFETVNLKDSTINN